jgi:hypothetical protein
MHRQKYLHTFDERLFEKGKAVRDGWYRPFYREDDNAQENSPTCVLGASECICLSA